MYSPSDDSFLFKETLISYLKKKDKKIKILDMGSGSGILAETCISRGFMNILAVDIDTESLKNLKEKGINSRKSNLFSNIKEKFHLIIFNPPYLPRDDAEPIDSRRETTGGKKGDEIILKFLKQAESHLNKDGEILLLLSSLTPRKRIEKFLSERNFSAAKLAEKKLFFESLEIYEIYIA